MFVQRFSVLVVFVITSHAACSSGKPKESAVADRAVVDEMSVMAQGTGMSRAARTVEVGGRERDVVTVSGYLEMDPFPTGKALQGTRIITKDGRAYLLSVRPIKEYFQYLGKWVVGTEYHTRSSDDPRAQSIGLFKMLTIGLAPGQKPYATVPTRIPHPPVVKSKIELETLPGRWALIVGKPTYKLNKSLSARVPHLIIDSATVALPDGFVVQKHLYRMVAKQRAAELLKATKATVVVRVSKYEKKLKVYPVRFCYDERLDCGMGLGKGRGKRKLQTP
ncbi:MAG: hypothetical protein ABI333_20835 [bacterium]